MVDLNFTPKYVPTLYDIHKSFDIIETKQYRGIKGEHIPRMVIFTNYVLGKNCVLLLGPRASGKTNLIDICSFYCKNPVTIAASSDKAQYRNTEDLNASSHFLIPEINKVPDSFIEVMKDIGEGKSSSYSVTDFDKTVKTFMIENKPFISSIAHENENFLGIGDELISRLTTVETNPSITQNKEVIEYKLKNAMNPFKKERSDMSEAKKLRAYVHGLPEISRYGFVLPMGTSLMSAIPPIFTDSRRDCDKYLKNAYGITLFHRYQRMIINKNNKNFMFVTPEDVWLNHIIYGELLVSSALKCTPMEKEILGIMKDYSIRNPTNGRMYIKDIHGYLYKRGYSPTIDALKTLSTKLYKNGYIIKHDETRPNTYEIGKIMEEYEMDLNWKDIVEETKQNIKANFPKVADEYIEKFCGDKIETVHPFTGEKINILTYKETKVKKNYNTNKEETKLEIVEEKIEDTEVKSNKEEMIVLAKKFILETKVDGKVKMMDFEERFGNEIANHLIKDADMMVSGDSYIIL